LPAARRTVSEPAPRFSAERYEELVNS